MILSVQPGKFQSAIGAASASQMPATRPNEASSWLALRASVLRHTVSQSARPAKHLHLHARLGPLNQAAPVGKICASTPQKRSVQLLRRPSSAPQVLMRCRLTIRSTGPIAAGRHLGYKSLAQMPAHRNRPVTSNVSHHKGRVAPYSASSKS